MREEYRPMSNLNSEISAYLEEKGSGAHVQCRFDWKVFMDGLIDIESLAHIVKLIGAAKNSEGCDPVEFEQEGYLYIFGESSTEVWPPEALDGPFKRAPERANPQEDENASQGR